MNTIADGGADWGLVRLTRQDDITKYYDDVIDMGKGYVTLNEEWH